jgi:proline iminopeptidase
MLKLFPEIQPFHTFYLDTGSRHLVYVEQSGNPDGLPVIFLHGGPCSGTRPDHRRFFHPEKYHIILFDQRACGLSLPYGELENNTTQDLLEDMERIRNLLGIEKWILFGGSWGATLALLYAQQFARRVEAMILRGTFLARQKDMNWFLEAGAGRIYPEQWHRLKKSLPGSKKQCILDRIFEGLWGEDEVARLRVAREWDSWGSQVALGVEYQVLQNERHVCQRLLMQVRMELHYAINHYFIEENQVLKNCYKISDIRAVIIHGRNDFVCPVEAGFSLYRALPGAEFIVLPDAGHVAQGEQMIDALVKATENIYAEISERINN